LVDGGYYENGNYYFYINDHLGNNRIVANAAASVVQSTQYYPFGMPFADATGASVQPYKYNNKELDGRNGLNWYDYSARYLALDFPVMPMVDPMSEKYYSWSPYAYVKNNPVRLIDPTGMYSTEEWKRDNGITNDDLETIYEAPTDIVTRDGKVIGHHKDGQQALYCAEDLNEVVVTPYKGWLPVGSATDEMFGWENMNNPFEIRYEVRVVGLENVHPEFDVLFAGRLAFNVAARTIVTGLSNSETRIWYNKQLKLLDTSVPFTEENAMLLHGQRNTLKIQAREMMLDRKGASILDKTDPIRPFNFYVEKYSAQGYSGESLWQRIIQGASTPNAKINSKFGIK
jgi:RHS repeat-associated protein